MTTSHAFVLLLCFTVIGCKGAHTDPLAAKTTENKSEKQKESGEGNVTPLGSINNTGIRVSDDGRINVLGREIIGVYPEVESPNFSEFGDPVVYRNIVRTPFPDDVFELMVFGESCYVFHVNVKSQLSPKVYGPASTNDVRVKELLSLLKPDENESRR
jgi:hypothetical protein